MPETVINANESRLFLFVSEAVTCEHLRMLKVNEDPYVFFIAKFRVGIGGEILSKVTHAVAFHDYGSMIFFGRSSA